MSRNGMHMECMECEHQKEMQEENVELKWGVVSGEVVRFIRSEERADTCMEVLQVMQYTREDEAFVAAVQLRHCSGGRQGCSRTSSSLATRMHGCYKLERL